MPRRNSDVRPGDPLLARRFNALITAANDQLGLTATPPLIVKHGPGGAHLILQRQEKLLMGFASGGLPAASLSAGVLTPGTGTLTIWVKKANATWVASTRTKPIFNLFRQSISANSLLYCGLLEDDWHVLIFDC